MRILIWVANSILVFLWKLFWLHGPLSESWGLHGSHRTSDNPSVELISQTYSITLKGHEPIFCLLIQFIFKVKMPFYSFLLSPGSSLRDVVHCVLSMLGDSTAHHGFSVLDCLVCSLRPLPICFFQLRGHMAFLGVDLSSLSLLTQLPHFLLEIDQQRCNKAPLWLPGGSPPYTP